MAAAHSLTVTQGSPRDLLGNCKFSGRTGQGFWLLLVLLLEDQSSWDNFFMVSFFWRLQAQPCRVQGYMFA